MATFEERVEAISGLAINGSSGPTQTELTEFLKDGVIEATNRCIQIKPDEITDFTRESSEITSQAGIDINGAKQELIMIGEELQEYLQIHNQE